ncbi:OB-fold nucleic acid binding domain-containing protein [Methanolobus sp. WCC4]|uniref:OB-fold nucleic acid binding domain-containing protein n=1 Tax=Methanolobus sp. WCC4 TaxID=3125784 RepID=UPI0030FA4223
MEKEEKIVVILLCMALLSLGIAYATFFSDGNASGVGGFSSSSVPGDNVQFTGEVLSKQFTYTGDHLVLDIDYGQGVVMVFVPSGNGAKDVDSKVTANDHLFIKGTVEEYMGELEVVVQDAKDVSVLE